MMTLISTVQGRRLPKDCPVSKPLSRSFVTHVSVQDAMYEKAELGSVVDDLTHINAHAPFISQMNFQDQTFRSIPRELCQADKRGALSLQLQATV